MENSHNKDNYKFNLILIGIVGFLLTLSVAAFFFVHIIINAAFTEGQQYTWVAFGEYFGGVLGPTLAFVALMALLYSIHYQITEFQKSTQQLKESSDALKLQNKLIQNQITEARDFHVKEKEIKKIDATNKLIMEVIRCFHDLLAITDNYRVNLPSDPVRRISCIPPIIAICRFVEPTFSDLHYLAKISLKYKSNSPANIIFITKVSEFKSPIK